MGPFPREALAANRDGRLTEEQTQHWSSVAAGRRKGIRQVAYFAVGFGALFFIISGPASKALERHLVGGGLIAFGIVVFLAGRDSVTADVAAGRVESVEGAVTRVRRQSSGRSNLVSRYLDIAGVRLKISHDRYDATPEAGYVRAFYLPKSRLVINLEQLPDRPVPAGPGAGAAIRDQMLGALKSRDENTMAEARAMGAALGHVFEKQFPPVSGGDAARGAGLRADDLVGAWTNPLMTLTFSQEGVARLSFLGGAGHSMRWSIDGEGRLHAEMEGKGSVVEARLDGDQLTVAFDGRQATFKRVG